MSVKDRFDSHPVVWGLSLLTAGAIAGYGFNEAISVKIESDPNRELPVHSSQHRTCTSNGLEQLSEGHHLRVTALQGQLMKHESEASDAQKNINYSLKRSHEEAATRIRKDIAIEDAKFKESLVLLENKCS